MKKIKNNGIFYVVISLVAVLAIGSVAAIAFVGNANRVIENVEVYQEAPQPATPVEDGNLGAVSGPDRYFPIFNDNGVQYAPVGSVVMQTATTTLCSIKNPFGNATSTLEYFDYQITTGTTTASSLVVSVSTYYSGTSTATNIGSANSVASGVQDSWSWSQNTASMDIGEVSPNEYVLLMAEPIGLGGFTYGGKCQAGFRSMP